MLTGGYFPMMDEQSDPMRARFAESELYRRPGGNPRSLQGLQDFFGPPSPSPASYPWAPPVVGGTQGPNYASGGRYSGTPYVQFRSDWPGSIAPRQTIENLLFGGGAGTMFDPTGNYEDYLGDLQGDLNRNTGAMLDRTRLRASLDPNIDPSQRAYAGLLGESSAFGGAQDVLSGARRSLAERNQSYLMNLLQMLFGQSISGAANPFVDQNLQAKYQRMASGGEDKGGGFMDFYQRYGRLDPGTAAALA